MNFGAIYSDVTGQQERFYKNQALDKNKINDDNANGLKASLKHQWLQSIVTQELVSELTDNKIRLQKIATDLAYNYHLEQNHLQIINTLIQVRMIENFLNQITE